jgi:glycosyltransferase involved in cell wall biosynthesis
MKIAVVVANFPPYFGGMGNVAYQNALGLANLGNDVTVFTASYSDKKMAYPKNLKVKTIKPLLRYGNAPVLPSLLKLKNFDVIHLHYPFYSGAEMVWFSSKVRKIPYVVTYHMDVVGKGWMKYFFSLHNKSIMKKIIYDAKKVFVTSVDYAKNSELKPMFKKIKDKVAEIPNGVNIRKFNPSVKSEKLRGKLGIKPNEKIILFVGGLDSPHYFKGVDILIKAFSKIKNNNTKLIIVGDGDLKEGYMKLSKELNVDNKIIFTGRVSDEDLPKYYALCDFSVLPSIDKGEAFGMVLVEAMASGKPVIASNLAGVRSVVDNGKNGLLVKPKNVEDLRNKIEQMLKSKNLVQMGKNGRLKAEKLYSWESINAKLNSELLKK